MTLSLSRAVITPAGLDRDGYCQAQTKAGAGPLTLNGALVSNGYGRPDTARHIGLYSAGDLSGLTFTITYLDRYGHTETVDTDGPSAGTLVIPVNCARLISVASSDAFGTAIEVGTTATLETPWVVLPRYIEGSSVTSAYGITGTVTCTQQWTPLDVTTLRESQVDLIFDEPDLVSFTTNIDLSWDGRAAAVRTKMTDIGSNVRVDITHLW